VPLPWRPAYQGGGLESARIRTRGDCRLCRKIAAGSIAMGLGGYLAARTDLEHYAPSANAKFAKLSNCLTLRSKKSRKFFRDYGLTEAQMSPVVTAITGNQKSWVDFMMRFELGLEEPEPTRARISALTIAVSYIVGD